MLCAGRKLRLINLSGNLERLRVVFLKNFSAGENLIRKETAIRKTKKRTFDLFFFSTS
jgi:hypothetical protein